MKPLEENFMVARTIKKINPRNADVFSEEIIREYEYPELAFYD